MEDLEAVIASQATMEDGLKPFRHKKKARIRMKATRLENI